METKKQILIVDDDIDVINVIETILSNEGYEVLTAQSKIEAGKLLQKQIPDLAIIDIMMTTELEGLELAKEIKNNPQTKNLPVLIQTSMYVIETTENDIVKIVHEYRKKITDKHLNIVLVQNYETGEAGLDYFDDKGNNNWVSVNGFIKKPVEAAKLLPAIENLLK